MTGRKVGDEIVQEYRADDGRRVQWLFTEITRTRSTDQPRFRATARTGLFAAILLRRLAD